MSLLTTFHLVASVQFGFTLFYIFVIFNIPKTDEFQMFHQYGGELRFLTNWNVVIQSIFFAVCLLNDLIGTNDVKSKQLPVIRRFKDYFHASIAFPVALFVGVSFWGLYAVDRELVFPKSLDPYFPTWLNHIIHSNVVIFTVIELFSSFRNYPARKQGLTGLVAFMLSYLIWTFVIFAKTGKWVYPILNILNWPQRIIFMASGLLITVGFYLLGEALNKLVWGKQLKSIESGKKSANKKKPTKQT